MRLLGMQTFHSFPRQKCYEFSTESNAKIPDFRPLNGDHKCDGIGMPVTEIIAEILRQIIISIVTCLGKRCGVEC